MSEQVDEEQEFILPAAKPPQFHWFWESLTNIAIFFYTALVLAVMAADKLRSPKSAA